MALINVEIDGKLEQMDDSLLIRTDIVADDEFEHAEATEYRLRLADGTKGLLVHRSAHVTLKKLPPGAVAFVGEM